MNHGLLRKSLREIWPTTLGFSLLFLAITTLLGFFLPTFRTELFELIRATAFFRVMLSALLGTNLTEEIAAEALSVLPWVHPVVLLTAFAHAIAVCTRIPASEIDRGTIDVLLGLPVSRGQVYVCQSFIWALSGMALILSGVVGYVLGLTLAKVPLPTTGRLLVTICNTYFLYLAAGAVTCVFSSFSKRRGRAIGGALAVVVLSFAISFVAPFWEPARHVEFLSLLT